MNRPTEAEVRGLTVDQLAEGARLLADYRISRAGQLGPQASLLVWINEHMPSLISSAQRVAEVEECVREIASTFDGMAKRIQECAKAQPSVPIKLELETMADQHAGAASIVREIAAEHNIDLSEPTPAGEAKRGATTGE